ncbi:hypothetical protein Tco_0920297 [Tanacetum coccineum]
MSKLLYTRFTKIILDYLLSLNKSIPHKLDSKLHSSQDGHTITKLLNTTNSDYKFGMEGPDAIISDAIKKKASGRGKGFMCYGDQVANVPNKLKKDVVPRKTRSLTIAKEVVVGELAKSISIQEPRSQRCQRSQLTMDSQTDEAILDMYNKWGRKLKGPAVKDPAVQEGSSDAHNKYYSSSDTDSDATPHSSSSDELVESANETDDADESNVDLSHDNPYGYNDDARYGVFMHNKSTIKPNSTYLSLTVTSSSLDFIRILLDETPANELMDFMSHPMYTDAHTTSVVHNPKGNPKLTSYISGASEVPLSTHVDVLVAKTSMQEMSLYENAHHIPSLPAKKISYPTTTP